MDDGARPYRLYQLFDHDGRPLRFGVTSRTLQARMAEYRRDPDHSLWCPSEVAPDRTVITELGTVTVEVAEAFERAAIEQARQPDGSVGTLANCEFNANRCRAYLAGLRAAGAAPRRVTPDMAQPGDGALAAVVGWAPILLALTMFWLLVGVALVRSF